MSKRGELLLEIPHYGEILLEPFSYSNGRMGYMCVVAKDDMTGTREFNLTLNFLDENYVQMAFPEQMYLKLWGEAEHISRHLMDKTDMFIKGSPKTVGLNYAQTVELNTEYYEQVS